MANCDISGGRVLNDCIDGIAGVKTFFFMNYRTARPVIDPTTGLVTSVGPGNVYRFEQDEYHGSVQSVWESDPAAGTGRFEITASLTLFTLDPEYAVIANHLSRGIWLMFYMDMDGNIRMLGHRGAMSISGGTDPRGAAPGDPAYFTAQFVGYEDKPPPFLAPFNGAPFDNMGVSVIPPYSGAVVLDSVLLASANDNILINNTDNVKIS